MSRPPTTGLFDDPHGEKGVLGDAMNPLDVPQPFIEATSYEVRGELQRLIERDLLGPWDGPEERFAPGARGPRDRYLVGMLGPKPALKSARDSADRVPDTEPGVSGDGEADLPEIVTPQNLGRMWASSMGLTFAVAADVDVLHAVIEWGSYDTEQAPASDGRVRAVWHRVPVRHEREVRLDGERSYPIPLVGDDRAPEVYLAVEVRPRDGQRVVRLTLVNAQQEPDSRPDKAWLYQSRITVTALDGAAAVFAPVDDPADGGSGPDDPEELHLRLLYRHQLRFAVGHNVAADAYQPEPGARAAWKLETTWLPHHDVPATVAAGSVGAAELSMDELATADAATLRRGLAPLADGYARWLDQRAADAPSLPPPLRLTGERAVETAREAAARIRAGIALLTDPQVPGHADALAAFGFANRVMALQRRHTAVARLREEKGLSYTEALAKVEAPENASWRPFQLAFVLLNLPSLTDIGHPERAAASTATVDLLFFPTGGGKTEAYLGLTAYTFAIRRLPRRGRGGSGRPQRGRRRRRPHALHAAPAHRPAVPARGGAGVRGRGRPPRRRAALGHDAVPDRAVGGRHGLPELVLPGRGADQRRPGGRQGPAGERAADAVVPLVRHAARRPPGPADRRRGAARVPLLRERRGRGPCPFSRTAEPARAYRS